MNRKFAFIIETSKRIAPFDDPVADVLIKERPLREYQREALVELGFAVNQVSSTEEIPEADYPCLVFTDDLFLNAATLKEFLKRSEQAGVSTQCVTPKDTAFSRVYTALQDMDSPDRNRFPLYYLRSRSRADAREIVIDIGENKVPVIIPPHMRGASEIEMSLSLRPLVQIRHPLDIVFANLASLNVRFAELMSSSLRRTLLAARALSTNPARLLSHMNKIGRGCEIHPTAWLEGAEIGDGVQIGARAVIRMSKIGDGCHIGDGTVVKHSVVGAGSVLFDDLTLGFAVCYPETFLIHGPYHLSVFGRSSAMFATILDDFRLDGKPIRLEMDGQLVSHPFPFIGSFIGHRTRVAGGSIISPGRSIPNDLLIFPSPSEVLTRVASDLPRGVPLFIHKGELAPEAEVFPERANGQQTREPTGARVEAVVNVS